MFLSLFCVLQMLIQRRKFRVLCFSGQVNSLQFFVVFFPIFSSFFLFSLSPSPSITARKYAVTLRSLESKCQWFWHMSRTTRYIFFFNQLRHLYSDDGPSSWYTLNWFLHLTCSLPRVPLIDVKVMRKNWPLTSPYHATLPLGSSVNLIS